MDNIIEENIVRYLRHSLPVPIVRDEVGSTNTELKHLAEDGFPEGQLFIAEKQSLGRGRVGRSFFSPSGGLYMSLLLRPDMPSSDSLLITTAAAVATSRAIEEVTGRQTGIKWVNDLFAGGKKVCGILTEASIDSNSSRLKYAILGIGINVFEPCEGFGELDYIAGALLKYSDVRDELKTRLAAAVADSFLDLYESLSDRSFFEEYKRRLFVLGKRIYVVRGGLKEIATVVDLDRDFSLIVEYDNYTREKLISGEISIIPIGNS